MIWTKPGPDNSLQLPPRLHAAATRVTNAPLQTSLARRTWIERIRAQACLLNRADTSTACLLIPWVLTVSGALLAHMTCIIARAFPQALGGFAVDIPASIAGRGLLGCNADASTLEFLSAADVLADGYAPYMPAAQPHSTPLMGHLMSTQFPSSSRSGSIALSLPGTSSSPEHHHDFGVERSVPMFASQSDMSYDTLQQSIEFNDAHPMMGYSTMANGYGNSAYVPGRPLPYGQPITAGGRLNHNIPAATPYQFTPMKVPTEYLSHVQGTNEYTDDTITDLAAVWCDIEEPPVPSPAPAATVIPATIGGQTGQTWAEHQRVESANMPRIPMAPPGAGPEAGYSVPQFVNQYENGSGGVMTPQPGHLEVPRMAASVHSSPLSQPIFFDPSKQTQNGVKAEHTPSPSMQHAMTQRAQGGDTLGQGLMPSPVDQSFPQNVILRPVQQGPVASPQPASTYYDANSPSNMLVPRHFSNSIFPLSPTGTQLPSWAQDRSFSSSSQQAQIMPSMSMTPGQLLGDDWEDVPKPPANLASPVPLSQSAPAGTMMQPSQRRVVTGYENPAV